LLAAVRELGAQRHIQVLSFDDFEQALVRRVGWDGRMLETAGDYLQFNEASVNGTKLNLIIQPEAAYRIEIQPSGDAQHELTLRYRNPLPEWSKGKDPHLVLELRLGGLYGGYLRAFTPLVARDFRAERDGKLIGLEDTGTDAGRRWTGVFLSLPSGAETEIVLRWSVPAAALGPANSTYNLYLQKQPGTAGLCLDLDVRRAGELPRALTISGGARDEAGRTCLVTDVEVHAKF
jgi:hypothetical protein